MKEFLNNFFTYIFNQLSSMGIADILDIIIVTVIFYYVFVFISNRRAGKLAVGVVFLLLALMLSEIFGLNALYFIMKNIVQVGILAIFIIFQPELRSLLEKMGGNSIKGFNRITGQKEEKWLYKSIDELTSAVSDLAHDKTGALIVIENSIKLGDEIKSGVIVNSDINSFLIKNIFFNKAPLHDGAMIIRNGRVLACGCFLPLSSNINIIKDLGTRHRAAIGITEVSDAIVIVVSEETGIISVAKNGELIRNFDKYSLTNELMGTLNQSTPKPKKRHYFKKNSGEDDSSQYNDENDNT